MLGSAPPPEPALPGSAPAVQSEGDMAHNTFARHIPHNLWSRRTILRAAAAGMGSAGAALLACGGDDKSGAKDTTAPAAGATQPAAAATQGPGKAYAARP